MEYKYLKYKSPIADWFLISDGKSLTAVIHQSNWSSYKKKFEKLSEGTNQILKKSVAQLDQYFSGKRKKFDLPLETEGTKFQKSAWKALTSIPYGKVWSYQEQAEKLKTPKAVRAVGNANSKNPISIIVPCHRVIAKSGKLAGYAGGLNVKEFLLNLEANNTQ